MTSEVINGKLNIALEGRIDSNNSTDCGQQIQAFIDEHPGLPVVIDAEKLEYISSAGLRLMLHVRKAHPELSIINVSNEVYEIFDMTGFNQMMDVKKAYRELSVEGCEVIGRGSNGTVYRIDDDTVVKTYNNADALEDIEHEREMAKLALILGIPTAISYEIVRVGSGYGSVFELLDARSFTKILATEPDKFEWCAEEYVEMLRKIHSTEVQPGKLPSIKEGYVNRANRIKAEFGEPFADKLLTLMEAVPEDDHMVHGDYHTGNLQLQGDEVLIIDMDTLAVGHPVFELGSMYNAFIGFSETDPTAIERFHGLTLDVSKRFWRRTLELYLGTEDEARIREVEDKARIAGYTRLIARSIKLGPDKTEYDRADFETWTRHIKELLDRTDDLTFDTKAEGGKDRNNELEVEAVTSNLPDVLSFIDSHLEAADCPIKPKMQIDVAVEEIFVNIANYAYTPDKGMAKVRVEVGGEPLRAEITFIDQGVPYDPLAKEDPDITLSAEKRKIGGLGIFLVKSTMDDVIYRHENGSNILTLIKNI